MNIDTMRWIDRHVGAPLCAVATGLCWLAALFGRPPERPLKKVLFVELSEMGTTVLASPAMLKARDRLGAELYFVIFRRNVGSLELIDLIPPANLFTIRDTSILHLAIDTLSFLWWTRRKGIDTIVDLELFSRFTALLTGLAGATRRVAFHRFHQEGLYRGEMLTHRVAYNPHMHVAKNFIALIDALAAEKPQVPYSKTAITDAEIAPVPIKAGDEAKAQMLALIQTFASFDRAAHRLILFNPNASELLPHRRWRRDRYAELGRRLLAAHSDVLIGITGAPSEAQEATALAAAIGPGCISLAGRTSLKELPALYAHAELMVSNDSGPAHFAAASGLPTVVLFGPETPKLYQPLGASRAIYAGLACSPCVSAHNHRKTACTDNVCMQAITVDQVFETVNDALRR